MIHENQFGKGVWMKLPEDGTTRISKPVLTGTGTDGKNIWGSDVREVPNPEMKAMLETYKNKNRSSVLGALKEKKEEAAKAPPAEKQTKSKRTVPEK